MLRCVRQHAQTKRSDTSVEVILAKSELAFRRLDGNFREGNRTDLSHCRFVSKCGHRPAGKLGRRTNSPQECDRIEKQPHLGAVVQKGVDLLVCHGLPPIRIMDYDLALEGAKSRLFVTGSSRADDVDDWRTPATDGHRFAIFDGFDQLRELILGVCNTDFHEFQYGYLQ
jgi:hypothetical protein